jgi:hypothetical protein
LITQQLKTSETSWSGKYLVALLMVLSFSPFFCYSQSIRKIDLLDKFITMHNAGTEEAIQQFIQESYHPSIYKTLDLKKQVKFYEFIINDFGKLNTSIYKTVEETPTKLIVQLIKSNEQVINTKIDPANILVVEIDTHETDTEYLSRGLGLGALICSLREHR